MGESRRWPKPRQQIGDDELRWSAIVGSQGRCSPLPLIANQRERSKAVEGGRGGYYTSRSLTIKSVLITRYSSYVETFQLMESINRLQCIRR